MSLSDHKINWKENDVIPGDIDCYKEDKVKEFIKKRDDRLIKEISKLPPELKNNALKVQMYHLIPRITEEEAGERLLSDDSRTGDEK